MAPRLAAVNVPFIERMKLTRSDQTFDSPAQVPADAGERCQSCSPRLTDDFSRRPVQSKNHLGSSAISTHPVEMRMSGFEVMRVSGQFLCDCAVVHSVLWLQGERRIIICHPSLTLRASVTLARSVSEGWHHLPLA